MRGGYFAHLLLNVRLLGLVARLLVLLILFIYRPLVLNVDAVRGVIHRVFVYIKYVFVIFLIVERSLIKI